MKNTYWLLLLSGIFFTTTAFQCEDTEFFEAVCGPFDEANFRYFPYAVGDSLVYLDSTGTNTRTLVIQNQFIFADTTILASSASTVCSPFAQFLLNEPAVPATTVAFSINQLEAITPAGLSLSVNFSDVSSSSGSAYFQSFNVTPNFGGVLNSTATLLPELTVDEVTYTDVILTEVFNTPNPVPPFVNDVRRLWIAPDGGIIQFEDNVTGLWRLRGE